MATIPFSASSNSFGPCPIDMNDEGISNAKNICFLKRFAMEADGFPSSRQDDGSYLNVAPSIVRHLSWMIETRMWPEHVFQPSPRVASQSRVVVSR
jgi:hypothetical protein